MIFKHPIKGIKNFDLKLPVVKCGRESGSRILFVSDYTSKYDQDTYLSTDLGTVFSNAINYALNATPDHTTNRMVVLNYFPFHYSSLNEMAEGKKQQILERCKERLEAFVAKHKPDLIVFSGDKFLPYFNTEYTINHLPITNKSKVTEEELFRMRGRFMPVQIGKYKTQAMHTLSIRDVCTQDPSKYHLVELLGFFIYDLSKAFYGKNRYNIPELKPKGDWYSVIDTMDKWKTFYNKLKNADIHVTDTETANLNRRYGNTLLTVQSGFDGKHAFVTPFNHRETPFTEKQLAIIAKDYKDYFENGESEYQIMVNGKFDCHIFCSELGVEYFNHDLCDIQATEYFLDENRVALASLGYQSPYSLGNLALEYGCLAYLDTTLGKKDRKNMASHSLEDIAEYGAVDAIVPYHLAEFGFAEAKRRGEMYKGYKEAVLKLGGNMTYTFVDIEHNGIPIDEKYLVKMMQPDSPLIKGIDEAKQKFKDSKFVQVLNEKLAYENGFKSTKGLFGNVATPWVFDIATKVHARRLFFDELGLDAISYGKSGDPSIDDDFIQAYSKIIPEVQSLEELRKQEKVYTSNIVSYLKQIKEQPDNKDKRIRSHYNYHQIITCRTGSKNPNQQNIPSRGPYAKPIKKQFRATSGNILFDYDLNANEVKNWGNVSHDSKISEAFGTGILLRRQLRIWSHKNPNVRDQLVKFLNDQKWFDKTTTIETKQKLAKNNSKFSIPLKILVDLEIGGDVHKKNYSAFFGVPAHLVTPEQRYAVKAIVFGVLYGKSAESLSREIWPEKWKAVDDRCGDDRQVLREDEEYQDLVKDANKLIDKMFNTFKAGHNWIKKQHFDGRKHYRIISVFGMVRHLWGYAHNDNSLHRSLDRRGPNSVIQGPSSNINSLAARLFQTDTFKLKKQGRDLKTKVINSVHDANYFESNIMNLPMAMYIAEHCAVTKLAAFCKEHFDWSMELAPEIAFSMGPNLAEMHEFDSTKPSLMRAVEATIDYQIKNYGYKLNKEALLKAVAHNWDIINNYRVKELIADGDNLNVTKQPCLTVKQMAQLKLMWG